MPQGRLIARLEFESVTPLWPGGPLDAKTYYCAGKHCVGPFLPDSKQLVGRMRWLLRTIHSSVKLLRREPVANYTHVDILASRLFGSTEVSSKFRIRIIYEEESLRGYLTVEFIDELNYIINRLRENMKGRRKRPPKPEDVLENLAYAILRNELGVEYSDVVNIVRDDVRDFVKLVSIPRIRLAFQDKNVAEMYELQPLKPGIRLVVEIYRRPGADANCVEKQIAILSLVYTLYFLGLGKASTRGFGRFKLVQHSMDVDDCVENEISLKSIFKNALQSAEDSKRAFHEAGLKLIELGSELLGSRIPAEKIAQQLDRIDPKLAGIPSLIVALKYSCVIDKLIHPCPYPTRSLTRRGLRGCKPCGQGDCKQVRDIIGALSAVGKASLKSTWKYVHFASGIIKTIREPGVAYHTWPLGLPRGVVRRTRQGGKIRTGYHFAKKQPLAGEDCDYNLHSLAEFEDEIRRQSLVFFTVACGTNACHALIEPFITYMDFQRKIKSLVHVGQHDDLWHVVNVEYAATRDVLGDNNCPRDRAGVAYPSGKHPFMIASDPIEDSIEAALQWIKYLLS